MYAKASNSVSINNTMSLSAMPAYNLVHTIMVNYLLLQHIYAIKNLSSLILMF